MKQGMLTILIGFVISLALPALAHDGSSHDTVAGACYSSVQDIPASCDGGEITSDTFDGGRHITCAADGKSLTIAAWDKPNILHGEYFEMYKKMESGSGLTLCLMDTCISNNGFAKSGQYPLCEDNPEEAVCGNDAVESGETCDDGNTIDGDGCSSACQSEQTGPVCGNNVVESGETCDDGNTADGDGCSSSCQQESSGQTCFERVADAPVECKNSEAVQDSLSGSCRTIVCESDSGTLDVLACDKDGYFEMYRQASTDAAIDVCLGDLCLQGWGYRKSSDFPLCTEGSEPVCGNSILESGETCDDGNTIDGDGCSSACQSEQTGPVCGNNVVESGETCDDGNTADGDGCSSACQAESAGQCHETVEDIPASCDGGSITSDMFNGGRFITCASSTGSLSVSAWDKPNQHDAQYFEMYKQSQAGSGIEICLGESCIKNNGYVKSAEYPLCLDGTTSPPGNETEGNQTNGTGENTAPEAPVWLEPPQDGTNIDTVDFHIQAFEIVDAEGDKHVASDFEVWDVEANERVWAIDHTTNPSLLTHVHNGDGVFQGNLAGKNELEHNTQYRLRARYYSDSATDNVGEWSVWQHFTTKPVSNFTGGDILWTAKDGYVVQTVATGLNTPVNIAPAPDLYQHLPDNARPKMYVTHLYGTVGVLKNDDTYAVYADDLLNYDAVGSIPGSGETGVDGLYVDPATGDLFVSMVYADASSRTNYYGKVVRFHTDENGDGYDSTDTILSELEVAPSHHIHQITRGPDGKLYVGIGDAHDTKSAKDTSRVAGKILRFNEDGSVPSDNPISGNYFYAGGFRNPFGSAWRPGTDDLFVSNNGANDDDGIYKVDEGDIFGWCCDTATGTWHLWEEVVAPTQLAFNEGGSDFPEGTEGHLYAALSGPTYKQGPDPISKRIVEFAFDGSGNKASEEELVRYTGPGYGAPIGLAFGTDGLYFTDIYGEQGFVGAAQTKGNIYKVVQGTGSGPTAPPDEFSSSIAPKEWYPKGLEMIWECKVVGGSGPYTYDIDFGDGQKTGQTSSNTAYHLYSSPGTYIASCAARDSATGETAVSSTTITLRECESEDFQCN